MVDSMEITIWDKFAKYWTGTCYLPFHSLSAAEERQWEAAKWLIEYGTDITAKDNDGTTVLHSVAQ